MAEPIIFFVTGITGTGKSTTLQAVQNTCKTRNLRLYQVDDRPLLRAWALDHKDDETLVKWSGEGDTARFFIQPPAYVALSQYIARGIAEDIKGKLDSYDVFFVESARGAGTGIQESEGRDRYDRDLFAIFKEILGDRCYFSNLELVVTDPEIHRKRVEERQNGAPWTVALKYMDLEGKVQRAIEQAISFPMLVNERLYNDGTEDELRILAEGLVAQALGLISTVFERGEEGRLRPAQKI